MKTKLEKVNSLERKLNIEVPAEVVKLAFDRAFKGIQKQAHLKGFRPGKAPMQTIRSVYGDKVKQDVVQDIVSKAYTEALREHSLTPVNYPEFEFDNPEENKEFSFTANFEVRPEVTLKKYEGLEVQKEKFEADDARVDQILENIRNSRAKLVDVLEDRPAQKGDTAVIDFVGFVDGKPLPNGAGTDHSLELGANQFIEGFEDGVIGMKVGSKKTLNLKFPDQYHASDIAGKPVDFEVTLKGLKKKDLPVLDDAFVAEMMGGANIGGEGETKTLEGLKATIRKDVEQTEQKRIESDFKNRILKVLVGQNPVDVPASMLRDQKQMLIDDTKKRLTEQGLSEAEFEDYTKKWDKDFETTAAEMIQSGFLIDAIAAKHELRATEQDLEAKFEEYAKQTGIDIARIKEFYSNGEQTNRLAYSITEEKVIELLLKTAKISEVSKDKIKSDSN